MSTQNAPIDEGGQNAVKIKMKVGEEVRLLICLACEHQIRNWMCGFDCDYDTEDDLDRPMEYRIFRLVGTEAVRKDDSGSPRDA